ncbi:MAG: hypothetical protein KF861_11080 [Planctomycetaceae bacterium]|nr:hypothetical protein [Planctomycetaceae bacterium]
MNRVLSFLPCECQRRRRRIERAEAVSSRLNDLVGDVIESGCRSIDPEEDPGKLLFWFALEIEPTSDLEHAAAHLAEELRSAAAKCLEAARALEGGAA